MKIIVSCHCDTVFTHPYLSFKEGIIEGANDNFASIMAVSSVMGDPIWREPHIEVQLTEDEEMYMDGAKNIATKNNPKDTLLIVMEVTEASPGRSGLFTIENLHEIKPAEIKKALKGHNYRILKEGTESEAWLYAEKDFSVFEICVPVKGGCHNLQSKAKVESIIAVGQALVSLVSYFKDKEISAIRPED